MEESTTGRPGLVFNWPDREPWEIPATCSLDVAEGSRTLEEVGHFLNLTRERIRQVEEVALKKVKARIQAVLTLEELLKCL
jgi:DNA-directed RNA polymerase sigma subunit (sigma70/sigma32)